MSVVNNWLCYRGFTNVAYVKELSIYTYLLKRVYTCHCNTTMLCVYAIQYFQYSHLRGFRIQLAYEIIFNLTPCSVTLCGFGAELWSEESLWFRYL